MKNRLSYAIIGGSGFSKFGFPGSEKTKQIETPYGTAEVAEIVINDLRGYFLPRHGSGHSFPPHQVPYRANIYALSLLGVERIFATNAVGSMNPDLPPGIIVIPDQFIDFTRCREHTFSTQGNVYHIDFTEPFCPEMAESLLTAADETGIPVHSGSTYVVTEGPRFETPAEINAFRMLGGDLVGMTLVPECVLARELQMCYLSVCVVTNFAAGMEQRHLTATEVEEMMAEKGEQVARLISTALKHLPDKRSCFCSRSLDSAGV